MPNDFYFIRLIHCSTRRVCPGERVWDMGHLTRASVLRFLRSRNLQGLDIYVLPYAEYRNAGYILLVLDHPLAMCCRVCEPMGMSLVWCCRPARDISRLGFV